MMGDEDVGITPLVLCLKCSQFVNPDVTLSLGVLYKGRFSLLISAAFSFFRADVLGAGLNVGICGTLLGLGAKQLVVFESDNTNVDMELFRVSLTDRFGDVTGESSLALDDCTLDFVEARSCCEMEVSICGADGSCVSVAEELPVSSSTAVVAATGMVGSRADSLLDGSSEQLSSAAAGISECVESRPVSGTAVSEPVSLPELVELPASD